MIEKGRRLYEKIGIYSIFRFNLLDELIIIEIWIPYLFFVYGRRRSAWLK